LAIFDLLTYTIDVGIARAPNEETAMLTNILLGLTASNKMTANMVSAVREKERRKYCIE